MSPVKTLSRERVVEAAIELLDEAGLDAFAMRPLADKLGVGTMTVYGYFRTRDEILDAVVDAGVPEATPPPDDGAPWRQRLRDLFIRMRRAHVAHPGVVELRLRRPLLSEGALRVTEEAMAILLGAGFDKRAAARAYRALLMFTFGFSAFGPRRDSVQRDRDATRAALSALPRERYPALRSATRQAADAMADRTVFDLGLDCLLDGIERRLGAGA